MTKSVNPGAALAGIQVDRGSAPTAARQVRELSVEITCGDLEWGAFETKKGETHWPQVPYWEELSKDLGVLPVVNLLAFPIHMNERGPLPEDLKDTPLGSAEMIARWEAFVADAYSRLGRFFDAPIITIGNEVDIFVDSHPDERDGAIAFLDAAAQAVTRRWPGARPVNTCTYDVLAKPGGRELLEALNRHTALVSFTWYDLGPGIQVGTGSSLAEVVAEIGAAGGDKPLYLQEISLPTGAACGGSEERQAARVHELFDLLGETPRSQLEGAVWLTIDDWPRAAMEAYIGTQFSMLDGNAAFLDYLSTLGLRAEGGRPKPSYRAWVERAAALAAARG